MVRHQALLTAVGSFNVGSGRGDAGAPVRDFDAAVGLAFQL
jgi:hypothetical protein